ncbi:Uncharacterised protein [Weeksella virosa]|nr:Uncharacterised protein [Weeksella virosa]
MFNDSSSNWGLWIGIKRVLVNSYYPNIVFFRDGSSLSLMDNAANEKVIDMLAYALLGGSVFILPFFIYLMYAFNKQNTRSAQK